MKILYFTLLLCLTACSDITSGDKIPVASEPSKKVIIKLEDSLGQVTLFLPKRYDTSFRWTHYSDCGKPCEKIKYRLQPKALPVLKESGWYWDEPKDSVERFTIIHAADFPFHDFYDNIDSNIDIRDHLFMKDNILSHPATRKIAWDTLEKIGDRYFSVIVVDLYDSLKNQYAKKLIASTTVKANIIELNFELLTYKHDSIATKFLDNARYFLHSVFFEKGK